MSLKQKEVETIKDLMTQELSCAEKYNRYANLAKDEELQNLFHTLEERERTHHESLNQVLNGKCPSCDCNDSEGKDYSPKATYDNMEQSEDKASDAFLATDCIAAEKMISTEYNSDVFNFSQSEIRKLLADIQIEEQNHAEMLYKYKTVNGMA